VISRQQRREEKVLYIIATLTEIKKRIEREIEKRNVRCYNSRIRQVSRSENGAFIEEKKKTENTHAKTESFACPDLSRRRDVGVEEEYRACIKRTPLAPPFPRSGRPPRVREQGRRKDTQRTKLGGKEKEEYA